MGAKDEHEGWIRRIAGLSALAALVLGCGDDSSGTGASATASTSAGTATTATTAASVGESTSTTADTGTASEASTTATTAATDATTTDATTDATTAATDATTAATDATTAATDATTDATTGEPACEDLPELCDALDNNCNDLFDEGCDCTPPDLELTALPGYTARVILDVTQDLGVYGRLGDVERAIGEYWPMPGEGVLFTLNNPANTAGGVGRMTQDGDFAGWVVDPADLKIAANPYLEYAYGGVLYACTTVNGDWIYKIYPDGTVETFVHQGNCEGIIFGDRGDGQQRLYASNYSLGTVNAIEEDGTSTPIAGGLTVVVDLAIPPAESAFKPGLYAINQTQDGVHRIAADNTVTLDYSYALGFGVGEEMSFAAPKSAFRDHFYHLSATLQAVVRVKPDGTWEEVITGPKLNYGLYSTGAVFSTNGAYYFFTNEDNLIMRLQACNAVGQ